VGDEAAPVSAARQSGEPATNALLSLRSFGCGCAALRSMVYGLWPMVNGL